MLKIWGRTTSSNVQKVLWMADELALPYERVDIGGEFGGNREPAYLALNPNGLVPTVEDEGLVLWESNSILRYLAAKHSPGGLTPATPGERALIERWMDWQLASLNPHMSAIFLGLVRTPPEKRDSNTIETARQKSAPLWDMLDRHLAGRDFIGGKALTIADICVGIYVWRWFTLPLERPNQPNLRAWMDRLLQRPPYQKHVAVKLA
jgi:glutathione S-transferase